MNILQKIISLMQENKKAQIVGVAIALVFLTIMFMPKRPAKVEKLPEYPRLPEQLKLVAQKTVEKSPQKIENTTATVLEPKPLVKNTEKESTIKEEKTLEKKTEEQKIEEKLPEIDLKEKPKEKEKPKVQEGPSYPTDFPAGKTVQQAWTNLVNHWYYTPKSNDFGIYTEVGKIILAHNKDIKHGFFKTSPKMYLNKPIKVHQRRNNAIVEFTTNTKKLPHYFLFVKTKDGWKFDLVNQKKLVKFGEKKYCGIEKYISSYAPISRKLLSYKAIDLPQEEKDAYTIAKDESLAKEILDIEENLQAGKATFEEMLKLGRLYSIVSLNANAILFLNKVEASFPDKPKIYKYKAISQVYAYLDYKAAQSSIEKYLEFEPEDEFAHQLLGFLCLKNAESIKAQEEFEKALKINPNSCYTSYYLTKLYGRKYEYLADDNKDKAKIKKKIDDMYNTCQKTCKIGTSDYERFIWLMQWKYNKK